MPGLVSRLPTQTECNTSLFCLLWFLSLHKLQAFLAQPKPEPQKNMLMLCPLKGFMYLFSSLLFKAFSLTLMFSLYHTALWLHLTRGQRCIHLYLVLPVWNILSFCCDFTKTDSPIYWTWHTVSAFAFCLCTLAGAEVEQDGIIYWVWLYLSDFNCSFALSTAKLSSPNTGLQNPMSSVGVGQPSAPTINTSTPIDPSSMQRAYAALGLPYSSQTTGQAQTQQASGPAQTAGAQNAPAQQQQQLPQQMRSINALGKDRQGDLYRIFSRLETWPFGVSMYVCMYVCMCVCVCVCALTCKCSKHQAAGLLKGSQNLCKMNQTICR